MSEEIKTPSHSLNDDLTRAAFNTAFLELGINTKETGLWSHFPSLTFKDPHGTGLAIHKLIHTILDAIPNDHKADQYEGKVALGLILLDAVLHDCKETSMPDVREAINFELTPEIITKFKRLSAFSTVILTHKETEKDFAFNVKEDAMRCLATLIDLSYLAGHPLPRESQKNLLETLESGSPPLNPSLGPIHASLARQSRLPSLERAAHFKLG